MNPCGTPPGTTEHWADWVAKRCFGEEPGGTNVIFFDVTCTVGSIVGYLIQEFILGSGIGKVLGKLKSSGKFASLAGKLSDGARAFWRILKKAVEAAAGAVRKHQSTPDLLDCEPRPSSSEISPISGPIRRCGG